MAQPARSRQQLIDSAAGLTGHADREAVTTALARYYRHVPDDDLLVRRPEDLLGALTSHRELAARRRPGTARVRAYTPSVDEHSWTCGHTVVEVVTDDMPFLVDSVTAELTRLARAIHLVVHPQLVVRRDPQGELLEVLDRSATDPAGLPEGAAVESWMHVEIDRETDQADLDGLVADVRRVLGDVRAAVEDWRPMREAAERLAAELDVVPPSVDPAAAAETRRLLRWLVDGSFTFVGYREYVLEGAGDDVSLRSVPGTGLGVLRGEQRLSGSFARLPGQVRAQAADPRLLILTKANSRSTVHRPVYLDYVGVKAYDAEGRVTGERRFLGLFTSAAYTESVTRVPVIDTKVREILHRSGFRPESHSGKDLLEILETYPRDELFQTSLDDLYETATSVLHLQERRRTELFLRRDDYGRFMSCLVYLPRDRYTTQMRLRMEEILREAFEGESVDYTTRVSESVLARLHFVVRVPRGAVLPDVDPAALEERLVAATRTWDEDLAESLRLEVGEEEAARLQAVYGGAFPEAYKEDFAARVAVADLRHVAALDAAGEEQPGADPRMNLYQEPGRPPEERRFKLYRGETLSLTGVLPTFGDLGVEVVDERPYALDLPDGRTLHVYDFGLRYRGAGGWTGEHPERTRAMFQDAFAAVWSGRAESDGLNGLVLAAALDWRQVALLRALTKYLRQTGLTFSQEYVESCLLANASVARLLVQLFAARFDPDRFDGDAHAQGRTELCDVLVEQVGAALDDVASLDHDRILRALLGVVRATLRTNWFQRRADGSPHPYTSLKLDPHAVPDLPAPRPAYEVWVHSPRVEGVHLRFGAVARGGLRWSDRREDFRTEVLGLVKAQMVKNAVIVPTGAKGGFYAKQLPDPAVDRDAWLAEGVAAYRTFISAMLDVTDDITGTGEARTVVPPQRVVRHDGDDTYLVVAADKGTATFSDIANDVAESYGFWLGDAFASGGSAGYDHKAMGITARGAWESVKRHFRELGVDTQTEDFTVVGVGDMSGDVFGNGMLLSQHIRLVAAFDHRHVFVDPDPDAAVSYAERRRLFDLPRSSWADYDTSLLSPGGGVYPRSAKSVPLSAQASQVLGLGDGPRSLTPAELMRAILTAPVALLWNGGIGTYVKAGHETAADVGDRANDAIRVDGGQLRARVVGEGGNLGLTQLGRIEAAAHGVRVNTDAIDNSAGVDTSDHEVNIKILLNAVVAEGDLTVKQRNALLADMTDDVAGLVLRDNYEQNVLLGNARYQAHGMLPVHRRFMSDLERRGLLDRALEFLPTDAALARRHDEGQGLTSPEFSVLVAYAKMTLTEELLHSDLPDDPWFGRTLREAFPRELVERYGDRLDQHPLRREIVVTSLANDIVNRGGITFEFRLHEETQATPAQTARAYVVAREVFGMRDFVEQVEALDNQVPTSAQSAVYLEFRRLVDRAVRWLVQSRPAIVDIAAEIERYRPVVQRLRDGLGDLVTGAERDALQARVASLVELGVPADLARRTAELLEVFVLLDVTEISLATSTPAEEVAALYFVVSDRFEVDAVLSLITALPRDDRWDALARAALRYDLYAVLEQLVTSVLQTTAAGLPATERLATWEEVNRESLTRVRDLVADVRGVESTSIAALSVALRGLRGVVRSGSGA
ncbi:NAD-glutamate dehydrogenase [Angustibacter aerolatus]